MTYDGLPRSETPVYTAVIAKLDEMDRKDDIRDALAFTSDVSRLVSTMRGFGMRLVDLAEATNSTKTSVSNWEHRGVRPNTESWQALDNLRCALEILVVRSDMDPREATDYLFATTPTDSNFGGKTLIEALHEDPIAVFDHIVDERGLEPLEFISRPS